MAGNEQKSVILFGKGDLAIRIANEFLQNPEYSLYYIVPSIPEPEWTGSLLNWAKSNGVQYIESGRYEDIPGLDDSDFIIDLAFSVFYSRIIEKWFIDRCKRILNLHNSPLPKYRGVRPINWALKNNEIKHGVTIHEITPSIDDGPIVAQLEYSIYPEFDEVIDVYKRALEYGWVMFKQTLLNLDKIEARPQDESKALYYNSSRNSELGERRDFTRAKSLCIPD